MITYLYFRIKEQGIKECRDFKSHPNTRNTHEDTRMPREGVLREEMMKSNDHEVFSPIVINKIKYLHYI